jgi:hypothetical protein
MKDSCETNRVTFDQLPEQIRKYYAEHFMEYGGSSVYFPYNSQRNLANLAQGIPPECSTWVFWHIFLWEDKARLHFSSMQGELWIDCWEKSPDGNWVLLQSASIAE